MIYLYHLLWKYSKENLDTLLLLYDNLDCGMKVFFVGDINYTTVGQEGGGERFRIPRGVSIRKIFFGSAG